jgi:oligopeptide/dipeptide ABC transporter ATP-binding protein
VHAVEDMSFDVAAGSTLGLVGESGSGKSTVGNVLIRLVQPAGGSIRLDGRDVTGARGRELRELRRRIAMVFQDPFASIDPRRTVQDTVAEPLQVHRVVRGRDGRARRVRELLDLVRLSGRFAQRYPHELSGGQRQRVAIARALAARPDLVILDEATASLDVSVQAQIINLLRDLQSELGVAYLFIAHDLAVVEQMSHRVLVMYLGRQMEMAPADQLFGAPAHPYTRALMAAVPPADPTIGRSARRSVLSGEIPSPITPPSGCVFRTRCPIAVDECAAAVPADRVVAPGHSVSCIRAEIPVTAPSVDDPIAGR